MKTSRGNASTENSLYSRVLCPKGKWHAICFFIVPTGAMGGNQQQNFRRRRSAMKTNLVRMAVLAVAAVTVAVPVFAGQTQAERERALRQRADPESALAWQMSPAMEAGSLSVDNAKQLKSEGVAKAEVTTVEFGGLVYRIGIDTP
jgi:hypothetical protein